MPVTAGRQVLQYLSAQEFLSPDFRVILGLVEQSSLRWIQAEFKCKVMYCLRKFDIRNFSISIVLKIYLNETAMGDEKVFISSNSKQSTGRTFNLLSSKSFLSCKFSEILG